MSGRDVPAYWKRRIQRLKKWRAAFINEQREREEIERKTTENEGRQEVIAALQSVDRKSQTKAERQYTKHVEPRWWQDRRFLLDVVGIVIAAGVGWIFWRQQNIMQGQLDELRAQRLMTIAQLRANLEQEAPQITPVTKDEKPAQVGDSIVAWAVSPQWINSGDTDARDYIGWFELDPRAITGPHHVTAADCPTAIQQSAKPSDIPRGQSFRMFAKRIELADAERAAQGHEIVLMVGHLEYRDIFPDTPEHHADWCVALFPNDLKKNIWSPLKLFQTSD